MSGMDIVMDVEMDMNNVVPNKNNNKRKNNFPSRRFPKKIRTDDDIKKLLLDGSDSSDSDSDPIKIVTTCNNPLCDHKPFKKGEVAPIIEVPKEINTVEDLVELGKTYHCKKNTSYCGLDLKILCDLVKPLTKLSKMVGMKTVKENMVNQIVFFLQGLDKKDKCGECSECVYGKGKCSVKDDNLKHVVIYGGPGLGKTELGKILGKVYGAMGLISKGLDDKEGFHVAARSDLVGKYLGHTAAKTDEYFRGKKNMDGTRSGGRLGSCVFLDEFYQFGDKENRDSFSKECLDTINQILSEEKDLLVIVAGYKESIETCIFPFNQGLARRFPFVYELEEYTSDELKDIFLLKVKNCNWQINVDMKELGDFFSENHSFFPFFGGDIETFLLKCKIIHGKRIFYNQEEKKILSMEDIKKGFELFKTHRVAEPSDMDNMDYDGVYMLDD